MIRVLDSAGSTLVEWGRQQQHEMNDITVAHNANFGRRHFGALELLSVLLLCRL